MEYHTLGINNLFFWSLLIYDLHDINAKSAFHR